MIDKLLQAINDRDQDEAIQILNTMSAQKFDLDYFNSTREEPLTYLAYSFGLEIVVKELLEVDPQQKENLKSDSSIQDLTYYDRKLQHNPFIYKSSPTVDDFMNHGYLVHVGDLTLNCKNSKNGFVTSQPTVLAKEFMTYWTLNAPVINNFFIDKDFSKDKDIIIKPLIKCIPHLSSVCSHEFILAGNVKIESGDIVILSNNHHKYRADIYCHDWRFIYGSEDNHYLPDTLQLPIGKEINRHEPLIFTDNKLHKYSDFYMSANDFASELRKYGIVPITYHANNSESINNKADRIKYIVSALLKELDGWVITSENNLTVWTHESSFKINEQIADPKVFFDCFLNKFNTLSHGYDYYSYTGSASIYRLAVNIVVSQDIEFFPLYKSEINIRSKLMNFLFNEIKDNIETSTNYSQEVKLFLNQTLCNLQENSISSKYSSISTSYKLIDSIVECVSRMSNKVFERFKPILDQFFTERETAYKVHQLIDNYNNKIHTDTPDLKSFLKDKLSQLHKEYLYSALEVKGMYIHRPSPEVIEHWFSDDIIPYEDSIVDINNTTEVSANVSGESSPIDRCVVSHDN